MDKIDLLLFGFTFSKGNVDMENLTKLILGLPKVLQLMIYEYNVTHRKNFYWVLKDINNSQWCQACDKIIKRHIYSRRGGDDICCSSECLDELSVMQFDENGGKWVYTGEDYQYIPPRSHYEFTNY